MVIKEDPDCALCELACMALTQLKAPYNSLPGSSYRGINVLRLSKMKTTAPVPVGDSSGSLASHANGRSTGSEDSIFGELGHGSSPVELLYTVGLLRLTCARVSRHYWVENPS